MCLKLLATDSGHVVSCLKEVLATEGTGVQQEALFVGHQGQWDSCEQR